MNNPGKPSRVSSQGRLLDLLTSEFRDFHQAYDLFHEFLQHGAYNKTFCLKLLDVAKRRIAASWDVRKLAILMLEHQILKLDPDELEDLDFLLTELKLKRSIGLNQSVVGSVLREGYSTTELRSFIPEFRRRLERLNRAHAGIRGTSTPDAAIRDFIETSRRDCKLSLARYLFTPEEVVDQILAQLHFTDGVKDLDLTESAFVENETVRAVSSLPHFEAEILKRLCESSNIYWVSETTPSKINSLVEYPITTVVLVIKPPGSDLEFEIKRAGRKGRHSLNVVFARNGYTVPPSHRLDGGCMQWLLRYETDSACKFSLIYRLVHKTQAPIPVYSSRTTIYAVPAQDDVVQTLPYFTDAQIFGTGFREMRVAMAESVSAFKAEENADLPEFPGALGLSAQFVGHVQPAQSILCGTSSFRLDKLAAYLSSAGPAKYFKQGLNVPFSKQDEKQLADELVEEVMGSFVPADVQYQNYEEYLEAVFAVAENRARADRLYLSLVRQIAKFWGTLLGVRGFSRGESFVGRNVGLKSVWDNGEWKAKIIFMDHDALTIPDRGEQIFYVSGALPCMKIDERHIWDRSTPERFATSEVGYLQSIYRIGKEVDAQGQAAADAELRSAYKKTQHAVLANPEFQSLFGKKFLNRLLDWDNVVDGYVQIKQHKSKAAAWKRKMKKTLDAKGYKSVTLDCYLEFIEKNWESLKTYAPLYKPEDTANPDEADNADSLAAALASR